jgi:hypothetical protein
MHLSPQPNIDTNQQAYPSLSPRRELDPPEAPCQANRKEGAGATGHLTRLLGAIPP